VTDVPAGERFDYDEFGLFHENVAEFDLDVDELPPVERVTGPAADDPDRSVSALRFGAAPPKVVFVHGGAQNAHTWDTVILALGEPALAVDLPGHGHSEWRDDGGYTPRNMADDVAAAIRRHAAPPVHLVGMSLGGLTSMMVAAHHPDLVASLTMVDITPGVNAEKTKAITDFVDGPQSFASFDDLLARTQEHNPTRSESSLRRGILHNAHQLDDGSWQWRYDRSSHSRAAGSGSDATPDAERVARLSGLWDDFAAVPARVMVVRGSLSPVVDDDDVAEARRRRPDVTIEVVDGAGHSIQGDRPVELAGLLADWWARG
jgi:pimeloyl-ACP methyl ester carboxylesterase